MNYNVLIKVTVRENESILGFLFSIPKLLHNVSRCRILFSADYEDSIMLDENNLSFLSPLIKSDLLTIIYGEKKSSKSDAINRDLDLADNWDIVISITNNINKIKESFERDLLIKYLKDFPDLSGQKKYSLGDGSVLVTGKEFYKKEGFVYDSNRKNNLIVNYYNDKREDRNNELQYCFTKNLENNDIDNIVVICSEEDYSILIQRGGLNTNFLSLHHKIIPVITEKRPTYNDYFAITKNLFNGENNINIISNLDIIIPSETLKLIGNYINNKTCLALSRWDIQNLEKNISTHFDRDDSQDTWIFLGSVNNINLADFTLGKAGCDNKIAYLLGENGYYVINPSKTLKTHHLHLTNVRNYLNVVGEATERIPPPYKLIENTA
jgi:hypothetical protein